MLAQLYKICIITALLILCSAANAMYGRGWETIRTEQIPESKVVIKDTDVEIRATRGMLIITTNHSLQIKIYSILGQLVTQDNLQPGTFKLPLNAHGVYIVKIGELTCKVAV